MVMRRKRLPMVGDNNVIQFPEKPKQTPDPAPKRQERIVPGTTVSSSDIEDFDWDSYEKYMVAFLVVHSTVEGLVDMWKANANLLDWAKKVAPDHWQRIRDAYAKRKSAIAGD